MNSKHNIAAYNKTAKEYAKAMTQRMVWKEEVDHFINLLLNPKCILDLGCGHGAETEYIADTIPEAEVIGIDFSEKMIELAEEKYSHASFLVHDIITYQPKQNIDGIWARASFHHLNDSELTKLFRSITSYLLPNGIIGMINQYGDTEGVELQDKYGAVIERYFNCFNQEKVVSLAREFGFAVLSQEIREIGTHTFLVSYLQKKLQ